MDLGGSAGAMVPSNSNKKKNYIWSPHEEEQGLVSPALVLVLSSTLNKNDDLVLMGD
jgi:hypothetical protein